MESLLPYLLLYEDDMLLLGACMTEIQSVKDDLTKVVDMKDVGETRRTLGMTITRYRPKRLIWLTQQDYVIIRLKRFKVENLKRTATPMALHFRLCSDQRPETEKKKADMHKIPYANIIDSIMYAMISTRPDVVQSVSVTSRFVENHGREHWSALK